MTATIEGAAQLDARLAKFASASQRRKIARPPISKGATVIVRAARRMAPVATRQLKKGLGKKVKTDSKTGEIIAEIGAKRGKAPHFHLVHQGTGERFRSSGGSTGAMPSNPFLEEAFKQHHPEALRVIAVELGKRIEAAASK